MTRIGLISDTHNYLDDAVFRHFEKCDEIWHAGDIGNTEICNKLAAFRPLKGVHGNIDGQEIREQLPEKLRWTCEEVSIYMTHIGGYPPRYNPEVRKELYARPPKLFIAGHSHILKIIYDKQLQCLHMNPGAAGKEGWHKVRTIITFAIDGPDMKDCNIVELGKR